MNLSPMPAPEPLWTSIAFPNRSPTGSVRSFPLALTKQLFSHFKNRPLISEKKSALFFDFIIVDLDPFFKAKIDSPLPFLAETALHSDKFDFLFAKIFPHIRS